MSGQWKQPLALTALSRLWSALPRLSAFYILPSLRGAFSPVRAASRERQTHETDEFADIVRNRGSHWTDEHRPGCKRFMFHAFLTTIHQPSFGLRTSFVRVHNTDLPFAICHLWLRLYRAVYFVVCPVALAQPFDGAPRVEVRQHGKAIKSPFRARAGNVQGTEASRKQRDAPIISWRQSEDSALCMKMIRSSGRVPAALSRVTD